VAHSCGDNVYTNFTRGTPKKFGRVKNVQNSARFLTTFDFDRKYLWNGSTYRKSEKYLINYISSPIGRKKSWWTLVHKPQCYRRACWPTQLDFFGETIFRPLGGAVPSNFTHPTSPINCISIRTWVAGRPQVGLCPIFLVVWFVCVLYVPFSTYCWLGLLTCKNRLPYNLYCVGGDVQHCSIQCLHSSSSHCYENHRHKQAAAAWNHTTWSDMHSRCWKQHKTYLYNCAFER